MPHQHLLKPFFYDSETSVNFMREIKNSWFYISLYTRKSVYGYGNSVMYIIDQLDLTFFPILDIYMVLNKLKLT